jgi:acyl-CoA hydrolase/RimJ/RimL family protein N-acetyltransferase
MVRFKRHYREKFRPVDEIFRQIHRGNRIFVGTGCGEPQYLVNSLISFVESNPKAFFDAEIFQVWTMGVAPYTSQRFKDIFRHNSFFVSPGSRDAVNEGLADYTPIFLSRVPRLFREGMIPIDVALIQVSSPDEHGFVSLGVSVDIVKAAVAAARLVIAQINRRMPRVLGDSFVHLDKIDYLVAHDEPLLELKAIADNTVTSRIGKYVARLVQDGDTLQVGYGNIPNAVLAHLNGKKHLGIHTELLTDGIVSLMEKGIVDNTRKTVNPGKTVTAFCMGSRKTYRYIHDNPAVEFRPIDYTNNPLMIARQDNMTAINAALEIDLTGQSTAESLGASFFSGVGGQADFMRGAMLAKGGKSILAIASTAGDNHEISRIVPMLPAGSGVTLHRGDLHYVVSEYGIAYIHGKNVRERAMELISIAHPKFRPWLIEEAKKHNFIYRDQAFIPGSKGEYPEELERFRKVRGSDVEFLLRPVKISDEPLLKDFFYSLSNQSIYRRFLSARMDMPHDRLQEFVIIDYSREMVIVATTGNEENEKIIAIGQYGIDRATYMAEVAFVVRDTHHNKGIGTELLTYLTQLAKRTGLHGFTAEVLMENTAMLHLFEKMGFDISSHAVEGVYELKMTFRNKE